MSKALFWKMQDGELPPRNVGLTLGAKDLNVSPEDGTIEIEYEGKEAFTNPIGVIQGGFLVAMLDDAMGQALLSTLKADEFGPTLELKTSFLAPAKVGKLVGTGKVLSKGGRVCFLEAELRQDGKLVAKSTATAVIRKIEKYG